jgi:hypothetical protein
MYAIPYQKEEVTDTVVVCGVSIAEFKKKLI